MPDMWRLSAPSGRDAERFALEANADRARLALACAYSSSDEFEADVIRARRAGRRLWRRGGSSAVVACRDCSSALIAMLALFVVPL